MKKLLSLALGITVVVLLGANDGCSQPVQSVSGTKMVTAGKVSVDPNGDTVEQHNIKERIKMDNTPGAIKHLYIISAYTGQVLIYSTVRGKVTSSSKRLTPDRVDNANATFTFEVGGNTFYTNQVLGEDGTYGSSIEYLYWWDARGAYHQHYVTGGQMPHLSDQPIAVHNIILNMELTAKQAEQ